MFGSQDSTTGQGIGPAGNPPGGEGDGSSGLIQYLAVFILLLGFFILMNALSRFEEAKVGDVLESVEAAFARGEGAEDPSGDRFRAGSLAEAATAVRELGELILAEIPLAKLAPASDGRTLVLEMPATELLLDGSGQQTVREDRVALLSRVAGILLPRAGGVQVRLEALLAAEGDPDARIGQIDGAGAIARGLVHHGAPAGALTVGMEAGPSGRLRLLFTLTAAGRAISLTPEAGS